MGEQTVRARIKGTLNGTRGNKRNRNKLAQNVEINDCFHYQWSNMIATLGYVAPW
jgi:hypothetical protein